MSLIVGENYSITITQGDSGNLPVDGLPTDKSDYTLYFAVRDSETGAMVGDEISIATHGESSVVIPIPASVTEKYVAKKNQPTVYYWGLAIKDSKGSKDTLCLGDTKIGTNYSLWVYPEQVV